MVPYSKAILCFLGERLKKQICTFPNFLPTKETMWTRADQWHLKEIMLGASGKIFLLDKGEKYGIWMEVPCLPFLIFHMLAMKV